MHKHRADVICRRALTALTAVAARERGGCQHKIRLCCRRICRLLTPLTPDSLSKHMGEKINNVKRNIFFTDADVIKGEVSTLSTGKEIRSPGDTMR